KEFIIDKGFNPDYGARPLRRAIENLVEDPLAEEMLRGAFKGKDTLTIRVDGENNERKLKFDATSKNEEALATAGGPTSEGSKSWWRGSGGPHGAILRGGGGLMTPPAPFAFAPNSSKRDR